MKSTTRMATTTPTTHRWFLLHGGSTQIGNVRYTNDAEAIVIHNTNSAMLNATAESRAGPE